MLQSEIDQTIFRSPSRASEPIIQTALINFHDKTVAVPDCLIPHDNLESSFGITHIQIRNEIPVVPEIHLCYTVDRSGSMSFACADGRTKMEHILHTLENMLHIFHKKTSSKISIRIQSFDSDISVDVETVEDLASKTQEELNAIIAKVRQISPVGSTNIEKALIASNAHVETYMKEHPSARIAHILLTDGEITDGSSDKAYLKTLVSNDYPNIFMGYGLDHDAVLLKSLASLGLYNEYRLVDDLEKAGLVYGEVIHQLLYPAVEEVSLLAESCELYNYATNTWTSKLDIGNLISEQQKIFHIRTTTPDQALVSIYGRTIHQTKQLEVISSNIVFQSHALPVKVDTGFKCDLTNYLFRQRTQEYLFETNALLERQYSFEYKKVDPFAKYKNLCQPEEYQKSKEADEFQKIKKEKDVLKQQIKEFFKTMLDYIENRNLKENEFYKVLCDDMYIALKSFDTQHGMMYAAARQTSQGRQQTYSSVPTQEQDTQSFLVADSDFNVDVDVDAEQNLLSKNTLQRQNQMFLPPPPRLSRGITMLSQPQPQLYRQPATIAKDDLDLDLNYTLSKKQTSAYSSLGVLKMMREVSYHPPEQKEQKEEDELTIQIPSDFDLP